MKQNKHVHILEELGYKIQSQTKENENNWEVSSKNCPYRKKTKDGNAFKCTHRNCKKVNPLYVVLFCRFCNCHYMYKF